MSSIKTLHQLGGSVAVEVEGPVLNHVSFIQIRKGNLTQAFSKMSRALLEMPGVREVHIDRNSLGKSQYIHIRHDTRDAVPPETVAAYKNIIAQSLAEGNVIREGALLDWAQTMKSSDDQRSDFENQIWGLTKTEFTDFVAKETGHSVGLEFHSFYAVDESDGAVDAAISMQQSCKSCGTLTSRNTLRAFGAWLQANLNAEYNGEIRLRNIDIMPDREGSPSYSYTYTPS